MLTGIGKRVRLCFNGAATLSLRKLTSAKLVALNRILSFNGAATLSLRKFQFDINTAIPQQSASMGPQLYRCGNLLDCVSHGDHTIRLQWGRNFIVAEIQHKPSKKNPSEIASMGPQLYRCGNFIFGRDTK